MILFRPNEKFTSEILLNKEELEHVRSLRLFDSNKTIEFRDGKGNSYFYEFESKSKNGVLINKESYPIPSRKIEIASALPKAQRFDFLLQKSTELGITNFYFINFLQSERRDINLERSNKIILEACAQSKRHSVPTITLYSSLAKFLQEHKNVFVLDPRANDKLSSNQNWDMIPVIGPEGGFREEELELLKNSDSKSFFVGENILRIETAHIYMASIMSFQNLL